ncbi:DUF4349 domain-containing protein [Leptonema illini]|jgi:hypothetical protein|uniref:DUF4349 domain-containing protein n=1 Tax=Leptonema illini DSM 21528 TaxID=929563 RepID=H2CKE0_9LEPT|nr:DUF4349 domain-containing protein [Leptonema illini]EHQ08245.1 hypothetical protein Lepil_3588 [Leptonema illini DSM 21528]
MKTDQGLWKRLALYGMLAMGWLFVIQLFYRSVTSDGIVTAAVDTGIFEGSRKNYASYKKDVQMDSGPSGASEKYEKIARLSSATSTFDEDRQRLYQLIAEEKGVIQFESLEGLRGRRVYYLSAGVPPEAFDTTVEKLQAIADSTGISIQKTDKTSEYLTLLERRASLEKTRASLAALKAKGGSMDEFLKLENRLLEIDEQLQDANLSIGQFNAENEFCTVQFSLREKEGFSTRRIYHIVKDSVIWTVALSAMLLFFGTLAAIGIWVLLLLKERLPDFIKKKPGRSQ